jgi:CO/xanthine dehydrogenase Mo-binding subunit
MAEVEVDTVLGTTKVLEIVAAHDVGRAINPTLVEGQIHGGIAQGLGMALMEEYIPGRTENLHDYLIPTAGDMPPVKTYLIEDAEPNGPFGAKGVGEPALIATAPAILSAIRHATGARITRVPALPHRLWEALQGREERNRVIPEVAQRLFGTQGQVGCSPAAPGSRLSALTGSGRDDNDGTGGSRKAP